MLPLFPKSEARVCSSSLHPIISDTLVTGLTGIGARDTCLSKNVKGKVFQFSAQA